MRAGVPALAVAVTAVGASLFLLPLLALVVRTPWPHVWTELGSPEALSAIQLSLVCSVFATIASVVLGVPLAWIQARCSFRGRSLLRALTTLPVVLPPVVGGVALLLAFGRRGIVGRWLGALGVQLPFTTAGAVLAETFVAMPFFVLAAESGFRAADVRLEEAARTLGASPWTVFRRVTLPAVRPALGAGAVLCWARALGEFGATITFAGNFPGRTQTLPLAVYLALQSRPDAGIALSLVLLALSLVVLVALRRRWIAA